MEQKTQELHDDTIIAHSGRPETGPVNRPVYRAATVTFGSVKEMDESARGDTRTLFHYGRRGNPNSHDFEHVMSKLEGGYGAITAPSGLAAITASLFAFLTAGDHILVVDTVYGPTREFCDKDLARLGVAVEYYDPAVGADIARLIRAETKIVYLESPGSKTYEIQDVPAIAAAARARGVLTMIDNTWATPLYFKPLAHGVDISIHAATKYIVGHADVSLGVAVCGSKEVYDTLRHFSFRLGVCAGPDDLYLALRGLRTLRARLRQHQENAMAVIDAVKDHPAIDRILYPALPDDPGHALWRRDFTGANGLFTIALKAGTDGAAIARMLDGMEYFAMGYSWGGYESLIVRAWLDGERSVRRHDAAGPLLRLHAGLEDPRDLIADLRAGLDRLRG